MGCRLDATQLWERACSRRQWLSQHLQRLTHRFREQARSHIGICRIRQSWLRPTRYNTPLSSSVSTYR
ncbi:hypothetical protein C1X89_12085 [Pseudomonas sp. GP01-A8]|nr:hypothetical protein C1X90_14010 [Pseudomonas sp. GP01-A9]PMU29141.1 hypothetical protein C1X88_14885 [Pseudomonas sp. GP01-A13]PMU40534.1 hypothetical protein C1X89_12085 [Pseudomonas sp. GP01-A8]PMU54811.1 hypothetical protein C1X87_05400 [Pseudomonas sp. GP01-A14]PMU56148.1 hypothetical protein C1X85_08085 [Pseudomonas sp. GP01-A6]PMU62235.1 hypothetical protein C1X86_14110 [Pseudomonas sp. GP01-A3]PMU73489.1 hypothetical protein C1X81_14760 [Pseudomonas sp. FW215-L2]PMU74183.1 hypothe